MGKPPHANHYNYVMKACFLQAYIVHVWSFAASWLHFICGCAVESGHAMKRKVSTEREEKADAGGKPKCKGTNMIKVSSRSHAWSKTVRHIWDEAARQSDTYETKMRSHRTKQNVKDEAAAGVPTYTTQISGYCPEDFRSARSTLNFWKLFNKPFYIAVAEANIWEPRLCDRPFQCVA